MADHGGGVGEKPGEKSYGVFTYDYSIKMWLYLVHPKCWYPTTPSTTCR